MPAYDAVRFDPPAAIADVSFSHPERKSFTVSTTALLDSGADISTVPLEVATRLAISSDRLRSCAIQDYANEISERQVAEVVLHFGGRRILGEFIVLDQPWAILGRNVLNLFCLRLDGPQGTWHFEPHVQQ